MTLGIMRGSRDHCLKGLRQDNMDLTEFPLRKYSDLHVFTVEGYSVRIFQGVNTVPQERFVVSLDEPAAVYAGTEVPGVIPFLVSTNQVSARRRTSSPLPTEIGLPLLTTESTYLIRWMFGLDGDSHAGQRLWRRLSKEELLSLPQEILPGEQVSATSRDSESYQRVSGAVTAPEPIEFVQPRAGGLPHEPWLARSVDLAEHWRVAVPNTSISCRPVIVPPLRTIIGQNFNVLLCPTSEIALAAGAVLSRSEPIEYLMGIAPWSQGDTPRPRSKHVNVTLWSFKDQILDILDNQQSILSAMSEELQEVWKLHLAAVVSLARGGFAPGQPLRESYRAIEPRDSLRTVPIGLQSLEARRLSVRSKETSIELEFSSPEEAAVAAVVVWTVIPQNLSIGDLLALRFEQGLCQRPEAVRHVLFDKKWNGLVEEENVGP